jgi:hypothetical protein
MKPIEEEEVERLIEKKDSHGIGSVLLKAYYQRKQIVLSNVYNNVYSNVDNNVNKYNIIILKLFNYSCMFVQLN